MGVACYVDVVNTWYTRGKPRDIYKTSQRTRIAQLRSCGEKRRARKKFIGCGVEVTLTAETQRALRKRGEEEEWEDSSFSSLIPLSERLSVLCASAVSGYEGTMFHIGDGGARRLGNSSVTLRLLA
jgi:hypothetical protein